MQNEQVIADDDVANFVAELMEGQPMWEGTASELLKEFTDSIDGSDKRKDIPKAANEFSGRLNSVKTNLAEAGIVIERTSAQRKKIIRIYKVSEKIDTIETSTQVPETEPIDYDNF